ncbi:hypothetical protein OCU04_010915 [Sclerotinia nivalis]|uniref:Uncharacterized protein n=1 Tax=Sclerotinia nivalis TaxID=352851 RepID=A0A9X0DF70_9HELO|nr:hypothetical protein OCU04_010915 [Sclerotinia nivalis]
MIPPPSSSSPQHLMILPTSRAGELSGHLLPLLSFEFELSFPHYWVSESLFICNLSKRLVHSERLKYTTFEQKLGTQSSRNLLSKNIKAHFPQHVFQVGD